MIQQKVFIIAEAGVNHNGSINRAKEMVKFAAKAGADAVKFQTFRAESLVTKQAVKAEYQKNSSEESETQFDMLKKLELSYDDHRTLAETCELHHIQFLSAPFDLATIDLLRGIGIEKWKIPSGEITNLPYLRKIASLGQEIILSTGMCDLEDIKAALQVFETAGLSRTDITILHCNTEYPTPILDVNLRAMKTIQAAFSGVNVGYSDHTAGIEVAIAAVAMGAKVIEKHFTLDKSLPGPDHLASLSPDELSQMIKSIRNIEIAVGNGIKKPSPSEKKNIPIARKSIVAACPIEKGEPFTEVNLTVKRPGTGVSPMKWDEIMGRPSTKTYKKDDMINA